MTTASTPIQIISRALKDIGALEAGETPTAEAARLVPNTSDAEVSVSIGDFVSNGIKIRQTGTSYNATGSTCIYAAFAENPLRYSNAR